MLANGWDTTASPQSKKRVPAAKMLSGCRSLWSRLAGTGEAASRPHQATKSGRSAATPASDARSAASPWSVT